MRDMVRGTKMENVREELASAFLFAIQDFIEEARKDEVPEIEIKKTVEWALEFAGVHYEDF